MSDMLKVTDLRAGYGGEPVLQGVSLRVGKGEIVAVIGRNGVGKSTLMRTLIGLLPVGAGQIEFAGREVNKSTAQACARMGIGYVPQGLP